MSVLIAEVFFNSNWLFIKTKNTILLTIFLQKLPRSDVGFEDGRWKIRLEHKDSVYNFLRKIGYVIRESETEQDFNSREDCFAVLGLLKTAEPEVCEAAYKTLTKKYHPDKGGDLSTMQKINEAWSEIKKILAL